MSSMKMKMKNAEPMVENNMLYLKENTITVCREGWKTQQQQSIENKNEENNMSYLKKNTQEIGGKKGQHCFFIREKKGAEMPPSTIDTSF